MFIHLQSMDSKAETDTILLLGFADKISTSM